MTRPLPPHNVRRTHAVLVLALWLLGIEVLPGLHAAAHRDDHVHGTAGLVITVTAGSHEHDDGSRHADHGAVAVEDGAVHRRTRSADGPTAIDTVPPQHAAAGVLHHALALHQPAPPPASPGFVPWATPSPGWACARGCAVVHASRPTSRGPPRLS